MGGKAKPEPGIQRGDDKAVGPLGTQTQTHKFTQEQEEYEYRTDRTLF